jgi:hypothetical protein
MVSKVDLAKEAFVGALTISRDLESHWIPVEGWLEIINSFDDLEHSHVSVTKAMNKVYELGGTCKRDNRDYQIFRQRKHVMVNKNISRSVVFFYIQRHGHVPAPIIPKETQFWQQQYDNHHDLLPRKRKKRKLSHNEEVDQKEQQAPFKIPRRLVIKYQEQIVVDLGDEQVRNVTDVDGDCCDGKQVCDVTDDDENTDDEPDATNTDKRKSCDIDLLEVSDDDIPKCFVHVPFVCPTGPTPILPTCPLCFVDQKTQHKKHGRYRVENITLSNGHVIQDFPRSHAKPTTTQDMKRYESERLLVKALLEVLHKKCSFSTPEIRTFMAGFVASHPTLPTESLAAFGALSRHTLLLQVKALMLTLDDVHGNEHWERIFESKAKIVETQDDFEQKVISTSPCARTLDNWVDELAINQAVVASHAISHAKAVTLQEDGAPDGTSVTLLNYLIFRQRKRKQEMAH